jgi:hypothetical protein
LASKSSKRRRRKRRQAHQAPTDPAASATEDAGNPSAAPAPAKAASSRPRRPERNAAAERPPAPWGNFPLVEIAVLIGIVMLILGFLVIDGERGVILVITGLALASIGGLEVAIREHWAGYRSHTIILAGVPAAIVLAILFYAGPDDLSSGVRALIGAGVFALAALGLVRIFRNRSGGRSFRFSGFGGR